MLVQFGVIMLHHVCINLKRLIMGEPYNVKTVNITLVSIGLLILLSLVLTIVILRKTGKRRGRQRENDELGGYYDDSTQDNLQPKTNKRIEPNHPKRFSYHIPMTRLSMIAERQGSTSSNEEYLDALEVQQRTSHVHTKGGHTASSRGRQGLTSVDNSFECPICYNQMFPPTRILQCAQGHVICEPCYFRSSPQICHSCRAPITGRNYAMEKVAFSFYNSIN